VTRVGIIERTADGPSDPGVAPRRETWLADARGASESGAWRRSRNVVEPRGSPDAYPPLPASAG